MLPHRGDVDASRPGFVPWREAWQRALYGPAGFYASAVPHEHFRTSVHASPLFSQGVLHFVRRHGLTAVTDYGAGSGELLRDLATMAPDLRLSAVELRPRPDDLPVEIGWSSSLPDELDGLLVANELLDNVPCDMIELDEQGQWRLVEVDPATGQERLGDAADPALVDWTEAWWPEGSRVRVEVGLARDVFWADACSRVRAGVSVAIDYGHLRDYRPVLSTLRSYRGGHETDVMLDGLRDVTAHVAIDSVASAVGATTVRQRDILRELGLTSTRPDISMAESDPAGYVHALSMASEAGELVASPGLGDLLWVVREHV